MREAYEGYHQAVEPEKAIRLLSAADRQTITITGDPPSKPCAVSGRFSGTNAINIRYSPIYAVTGRTELHSLPLIGNHSRHKNDTRFAGWKTTPFSEITLVTSTSILTPNRTLYRIYRSLYYS
jgi:hypothetical protein